MMLPPIQRRIYNALLMSETVMPSAEDLAEAGGCTTGTVGAVIRQFGEKGLITIHRDRKGRRTAITIAGRKLKSSPRKPYAGKPECVSEIKIRSCLKCRNEFTSRHIGERVCQPCKETVDWMTGELVAV